MSDDQCLHCGEPVTQKDMADGASAIRHIDADGSISVRWHHFECRARGVLGSVGHLRGKCSCYGGTEEDPPEMSRREAARAALHLFRQLNERLS